MVKILLLALVLRLFSLSTTPASLNWDEVSQGYTAYSVSETGKDEWGEKTPIFFRSYGEWKSATYIYLLIPFIRVFGLTPLAIRLPSAILGVVSVYLIYLLGKKLFSKEVGLWASFLMAVTPWSLFLSRPAFEANVSLTLFLAGIYLLLKIGENNSKLNQYFYPVASAIMFGLSPHTYNSAKVVVPLLVLFLIYWTKLYKNLKSLFLLLFVLALFALPIISNLFSGYSQARYTQVSITTDGEALTKFYELRTSLPLSSPMDKILINKGSFFIYQFVDNFLSYLSPGFLAWHGGRHTQQSMPYHGVLYLTQFVALVIGFFVSLKHKNIALIYLLIILGLIPASMTRDPEHALRAILAIPGYIFLASLGFDHLRTSGSKITKPAIYLLVLEVAIYSFAYFGWYARAYARDWQYGYVQLSSYLKAHEHEYDEIVVTKWYGEPQLFLAFYSKWDPTWYQAENQQNLSYENQGKMWLDQLDEYHVGKYTFKYLNWQEEKRTKNTLYVGKGDDFYPDSNILETIKYPDGKVAFHIVVGDK